MPGFPDSRIGLGERLAEAGVDVVDIDPGDTEALEARPLARDELHVAFLHAERVRDERRRRRVALPSTGGAATLSFSESP